jgi:hypothetical protein
MRERDYQAYLIKKIRRLFPGCVILKNDSAYMQGIPDLTILYGERWVMLEVKKSEDSPFQPNQEFYISQLNEMSFAVSIFPANEKDVFHELQRILGRNRRLS